MTLLAIRIASAEYRSPVYALEARNSPQNVEKTQIKVYSVNELIEANFGSNTQIALAVLRAENNTFNPRAIGYNCRYGQKVTACKKQDVDKAISVDCGLFQIHSYTGNCPKELFDPEINIKQAKKLFDEREKITGDGFECWYAYKNKLHLKYL